MLKNEFIKIVKLLLLLIFYFSHCKEHSWDYERKIGHNSKYSIFSASASDEEEEINESSKQNNYFWF